MVETRSFPAETLRSFSARVFEHFGVPEEDAWLAIGETIVDRISGLNS